MLNLQKDILGLNGIRLSGKNYFQSEDLDDLSFSEKLEKIKRVSITKKK